MISRRRCDRSAYGEVKLDMNARLEIGAAEPADGGRHHGGERPRGTLRAFVAIRSLLWLRLLCGIGGIRLTGCELRAGAGAGDRKPPWPESSASAVRPSNQYLRADT